MKKYYYLLLFALMISATAQAQADWITKKLDGKILVKFPTQPEKVVVRGIDTYTSKGKDSIVYTLGVADLKALAQLDSAMLDTLKDNPQFAQGIKIGMAQNKTNYTFGDISVSKWNTYACYTLSAIENTNKTRMQAKIILIGSKIYTLTCQVPGKLVTTKNEVFLNSAELVR